MASVVPHSVADDRDLDDADLWARTPTTPVYSSPEAHLSPEIGKFSVKELSPRSERYGLSEEKHMVHSLSGRFPSVSLFKEYQNTAMAILERSDYVMISGNPFIKKSGWRKISFYFNLSFEIRDKTIEFDENRNVQRAEFVVRAYMQTCLELENINRVQAKARDEKHQIIWMIC
uniref:Uncharacterized protein n=2 Tax=Quercus lobata TaxID=97700 RepID=A0A7N2N971_QUELO